MINQFPTKGFVNEGMDGQKLGRGPLLNLTLPQIYYQLVGQFLNKQY